MEVATRQVREITPSEALWGDERPFYRRPLQHNRRLRPSQKWFLVASFLAATVFAYHLGLNRGSATSSPIVKRSALSVIKPAVELVVLKGGEFTMGDPMDGLKDARIHQVNLAPFMIAKHEVSLELWERVRFWGKDHGYPDLPTGSGKGGSHPVYGITWGTL